MIKKLPLFYCPSTICWIDDNKLFLEAANSLFKDTYNCITFYNSEEAIQFLNLYQSPYTNINFTREFTESDIFDTHNRLPIDINISEITKLAYTPSIREEIAILVIDNNMPKITGLELCHQLKNTSYKKILLTGETGQTEVIDAFNDGIIDKFIKKDKNVSENLQNAIFDLSYQYFYEKSKSLLAHLQTSRPSPLSDQIFIDFFQDWRSLNECNEFYLINRHGSFLVKNNHGIISYFIMMTEHAKNEFLSLYDDQSYNINNLLLQVERGKTIPFFGIGKESWEFNQRDWDRYFYPASILQGREKYYWTTIKEMEK